MNIFQIYHDKTLVPVAIPQHLQRLHPGCNYRLLDFEEGKQLVRDHMTQELAERVCYTIDNLPRYCHKSDLLRYCLLYIFGGFYLDVDLYLVKPINAFIPEDAETYGSFGLGPNPRTIDGHVIHQCMANGFLGSKRQNNPVLMDLIRFCLENTRLFRGVAMERGDNVYHMYDYLAEKCAEHNCTLQPYTLLSLERTVYLINTREQNGDLGTNCMVDSDGTILVNPNLFRIPRQTSGPLLGPRIL